MVVGRGGVGRLILVKYVMDAFPTYMMSLFLIRKSIEKRLTDYGGPSYGKEIRRKEFII